MKHRQSGNHGWQKHPQLVLQAISHRDGLLSVDCKPKMVGCVCKTLYDHLHVLWVVNQECCVISVDDLKDPIQCRTPVLLHVSNVPLWLLQHHSRLLTEPRSYWKGNLCQNTQEKDEQHRTLN